MTNQHRAGLIRPAVGLICAFFAGIYSTMTRSSGPAGFTSPAVDVASSRLKDAVAASLAVASLSLCLMVTLAVLSGKLGAGLPIPA